MNRDNLNLLIDALEDGAVYGEQVKLNMESYIHKDECGTVACIAGHCALLGGMEEYNHGGVLEFARDWLDIPYKDAISMFIETGPLKYKDITVVDAVKTLRNFRETGKIEWIAKCHAS